MPATLEGVGRDQMVDNFLPSTQWNPHTSRLEHSEYAGDMISNDVGDRNFARLRRPYFDKNGHPAVTINTGRWTTEKGEKKPILEHVRIRDLVDNYGIMLPVFNATSLRKEEWLELDRVVLRAARYRLLAWGDLASHNSFGGFNGMSKEILEHETMSDPGEAIIDMDGLTEGRTDAPKFQLEGLPLPITHSDFWFGARKLSISRNTGTPLDTTMGEAAGRRVGESVEKVTIGMDTGSTYGGNSTHVGGYGRTSRVYGYINFPARLTKTNMTAPTSGSWTPETTQIEFNACLQLLRLNRFYGPFMVYTTNDWDPYLDGDYYVARTSGAVAPTKSLRSRLLETKNVVDIKSLDFFFGSAPTSSGAGNSYDATLKAYSWVFVQMTPDTARAVNGMSVTTLQWESVGGMRLNFKVMTISVPQLRADYYGNCGILHATTS